MAVPEPKTDDGQPPVARSRSKRLCCFGGGTKSAASKSGESRSPRPAEGQQTPLCSDSSTQADANGTGSNRIKVSLAGRRAQPEHGSQSHRSSSAPAPANRTSAISGGLFGAAGGGRATGRRTPTPAAPSNSDPNTTHATTGGTSAAKNLGTPGGGASAEKTPTAEPDFFASVGNFFGSMFGASSSSAAGGGKKDEAATGASSDDGDGQKDHDQKERAGAETLLRDHGGERFKRAVQQEGLEQTPLPMVRLRLNDPATWQASNGGTNSNGHGDGERPSCAICLEPFEDREYVCRLPCQHSFHEACIREWLGKGGSTAASVVQNKRCPVCNLDLHPTHAHRRLRLKYSELKAMSIKELKYLCVFSGVRLDKGSIVLVEKSDVIEQVLKSKVVEVDVAGDREGEFRFFTRQALLQLKEQRPSAPRTAEDDGGVPVQVDEVHVDLGGGDATTPTGAGAAAGEKLVPTSAALDTSLGSIGESADQTTPGRNLADSLRNIASAPPSGTKDDDSVRACDGGLVDTFLFGNAPPDEDATPTQSSPLTSLRREAANAYDNDAAEAATKPSEQQQLSLADVKCVCRKLGIDLRGCFDKADVVDRVLAAETAKAIYLG